MRTNERLRQARESLKISQKAFAKELGIGQVAMSKYENGQTELKSEILHKLLKSYNINIIWILTGDGEMFLSNTVEIAEKNQNIYNFFPYSLDINAVPTIISALKKELNQITEIISADIYEQNLSLREMQVADREAPDFYIPDVGILDEIIDLYKKKRASAKEGISEIQAKEIALKIQTLKLDYQRSAKHEYKIDALLRHWTSIIEQEFENGII